MKSIYQIELEDKFNRKIKYREKKIETQRKIIGKQQEEIERLNNIINELYDKKEKLLKYKRFIYNIIITPVDWKNPYHYQLHNYTKRNLYEQLYNLREEIIEELKGSDK